MEKEMWKVFLACAIGAFIGSFVALEVSRMFWWVGLIVGGASGYLSYEWRAVLRAIPAAWNATRNALVTGKYTLFSIAICVFVSLQLVSTIAVLLVYFDVESITTLLLCLFFFAVILGITFIPPESEFDVRADPIYRALQKFIEESPRNLKSALFFSFLPIPIAYLLWKIIINLPKAILAVFRAIVFVAKFAKRFIWEVFIRIHSEVRLLCGVDAMVGATIGFFSGSAIIGALAGGLFGVFNYAVVTKRWLIPRGYIKLSA